MSIKEKIQAFYTDFQSQSQYITSLIEEDDQLEAKHQLESLEQKLQDSLNFLPKYDHRQYTLQLRSFYQCLSQKSTAKNKKKFGFKRKEEPTNSIKKEVEQPAPILQQQTFSNLDVNNRHGETIHVNAEDIHLCDISLFNLTDCTVILPGVLTALRCSDVSNCVIRTSAISGSVFVTNAKKCEFFVSCQQMRVHHTEDTLFHLHVSSKMIIEDSTGIRVAALSPTEIVSLDDFKEAGLDQSINFWYDVQDFNWLKGGQSPNWKVEK